MFKDVKNPPDFPALDHATLKRWEEERIFERSIEEREGGEDYVFYDGPPGTNGKPHVGHIMQSALKDLWPRFETMRGKRVLRKAGWDTHGLPIELTADRDLGLTSKLDIEAYGVQKYVDYCRETVFRYKESWEEAIHRLGRFLDMKDFYATYTNNYIQSDWWVLKQAWNTKVKPEYEDPTNLLGGDRFLYKDYRVSAWCPTQGTTLSNFEVAQGYREVTEIALFPKFKVVGEENTYLVAWTTTAWTLLSNIAVAAGPNIEYVRLEMLREHEGGSYKKGERLILAKERLTGLENFLGGADAYRVEASFPGKELAGTAYEPLWGFQQVGEGEKGHFVIADNYVTADDGTGLVHLAPYGEDDYRLIKLHKLNFSLRVDEHGKVVEGVNGWGGRWFKDEALEIEILKDLKQKNELFAKEKHTHTYPFNYKTGTPLVYFPRPGWFIRATAMRDEMLEANTRINWFPDHIRDGRFGKWLENVVDWNITRERFWGSPLPVWVSEDGSDSLVIESIDELNKYLVAQGDEPLGADADLHKPGIDQLIIKRDGKEFRREPFVLDSWFNAGIMPWGQTGYPAKNGSVDYFNAQYPADFICEGLDQTRGWFYSLLAASTLLAISRGDEDRDRWSSYKNVICTDLVLDESGEKMSKSKGNVVAPVPLMEKYGADAIRWSFYRNNPWLPVRFGEEPIKECLRQVFIPLWNAYSFFVTYANVDEWTPGSGGNMADATPMDRWILTCYNDTVAKVTERLEAYDVMPAAAEITDFLDRLTNWYIRRSRRRFWKSDEPSDKLRAYDTLYTVLTGISRLMAPFAPFISDEMYQNLVRGQVDGSLDSVHLGEWPAVDASLRDDDLKVRMDYVRDLVSVARSARNDAKLKVRQPLASLIVVADEDHRSMVAGLEALILDELNVKGIDYVDSPTELATYKAKANFPVLGPRFGKDMKSWADKILALSEEDAGKLADGGSVEIDGQTFTSGDVVLQQIVPEHLVMKEEAEAIIALDTRLDEALVHEGYARELINRIQNKRKELQLEVTQRIKLEVRCDGALASAVQTHEPLIAYEVLADSIEVRSLNGNDSELVVNDQPVSFTVAPVETN